jgi:hypothetical protein
VNIILSLYLLQSLHKKSSIAGFPLSMQKNIDIVDSCQQQNNMERWFAPMEYPNRQWH